MGETLDDDVMRGSASFATTAWSIILSGREGSAARHATETLILEQYWKPVYCFLRHRGISHANAADLTQEFFTEIVLGRSFIDQADPGRGRFRAFLLTALKNFMVDSARKAAARSRRPERPLISLSGLNPETVPETSGRHSPEAEYHYRWAMEMLARSLDRLSAECRSEGLEKHWQVFRARWLGPLLEGAEPAPFESLCRQLNIASVKQASNMLQTIRRRFAGVLRRCVAPWVADEAEIDREIRDLMSALSGAA